MLCNYIITVGIIKCTKLNLITDLLYVVDPNFPRTYESVIDPIEKLSVPFDYAWSVVKTLNLVKNKFMPSDGYLDLHNRARTARSKKYHSLPIYYACKVI